MADKKISELSSAGALSGTEEVAVNDGGTTRKTTTQEIADLASIAAASTNLSVANKTATTLDILSDTGTDATVPQATITEAGLLIATDKVKLNNTTNTNSGDETNATIKTKLGASSAVNAGYVTTSQWTDWTAAYNDTVSILSDFISASGIAAIYQTILVSGTSIKTVNSTSLLGSGNISVAETTSTLGATINGAAAATPNDTDLVATVESSVVKKITWTNVKAFLKTYFDTLYLTDASTSTLTNKRITKRVGSTTSSATPTINTDNYDVYKLTAQSAAITSFTTNLSGTPTDGQLLWIQITDDGSARAITWGSSFEASTIALPTTTVISTRLDVGFVWNTATSKWRCVASA